MMLRPLSTANAFRLKFRDQAADLSLADVSHSKSCIELLRDELAFYSGTSLHMVYAWMLNYNPEPKPSRASSRL